MGKGGSPPPAPDYAGAAKQQGAANVETAITQGHINNPQVYGPYGSQTVEWNGGDVPIIKQTLSPEQQAILNQQQAVQLQLGNLAQQGAGAASGIIGQPVDFSGAPGLSGTNFGAGAPGLRGTDFTSGAAGLRSTDFASQAQGLNSNDITAGVSRAPDGRLLNLRELNNINTNANAMQVGDGSINNGVQALRSSNLIAGNPAFRSTQFTQGANEIGTADAIRRQVIDAMMSRVNEDIGIQRDDANSNLIAAGLHPGSTAYDSQQNLINRAQNDARQQAIIAGGNAAQQQFAMDMARRQQTVGENQDMFAATAAQRAQMTDEQRQMFDAAQRGRAQQVAENQQNFQNRFNIRGQQVGESQQNFANSALARNMSAQEAGQEYQQLMGARQQGVNENQQMYQNSMAARQQDLNNAQNQFAASLGARQQNVNEQAQMFGASQAARQQQVSENAQQFGATQAARQQAIQEMLAQRSVPLNEISALAGGSQVSNPFSMPGYAQNTQVAPPPLYQATTDASNYNTDLYNSQQAQQGQLTSGLFGLGGTGLMAGGMFL